MTRGLADLTRRWVGALALLSGLLPVLAPPATAQPAAQTMADVERVGTLLREGRNLDAVDLARRIVAAAPPSERTNIYEWAGWVCRTTLDFDCTQDLLVTAMPHMQALLRAPGADRASVSRNLLPMLTYQVATGDYQGAARFLSTGVIPEIATAVRAPVLFAELQLLAAQRSRRLGDFEASRDHLDKALIATFSLIGPDRFDAPRLLVRIAGQLLDNYDTERALRLVAAAGTRRPGSCPAESS